jgi:hypothetical protein
MKGQIIINVEGEPEAVNEYLNWWKENEDSDNAYTNGPLDSWEKGVPKPTSISCQYEISTYDQMPSAKDIYLSLKPGDLLDFSGHKNKDLHDTKYRVGDGGFCDGQVGTGYNIVIQRLSDGVWTDYCRSNKKWELEEIYKAWLRAKQK